MPKQAAEPWYAEKRAMAYVSSLFAMQKISDLTESSKEVGVDLVIDVADERAIGMRRVFAIQIKGFRELPGVLELNRRISKEPSYGHIDKIEVPLLLCAVSFVNLEAVYCWLLEPIVEKGRSGLLEPAKHDWRPLDDNAAPVIVAKVSVFYDALFDLAANRRRS